MCLYPRYIKNKRYEKTEKNGGYPRKLKDVRKRWIEIPCGECLECRKKAANEWRIRLNEEDKYQDMPVKIVTLSFSPESLSKLKEQTGLEECNAIATIAVRRFLERWRKTEKKSVRHWFVTELGHKNSERIHLHGFIWTEKDDDFIEKKWKYGNVNFGYKSGEKTISYVTKYVRKLDKAHPDYKQIVLTSPGIGKKYLDWGGYTRHTWRDNLTITTYQDKHGTEQGLPKYYRTKVWTDSQRGRLWTIMLDKNTKYCGGMEFDLNEPNGEKRYLLKLESQREYSNMLGYGKGNYKTRKRKYNITRTMLLNYKDMLLEKNKTQAVFYDSELQNKTIKNSKLYQLGVDSFESLRDYSKREPWNIPDIGLVININLRK